MRCARNHVVLEHAQNQPSCTTSVIITHQHHLHARESASQDGDQSSASRSLAVQSGSLNDQCRAPPPSTYARRIPIGRGLPSATGIMHAAARLSVQCLQSRLSTVRPLFHRLSRPSAWRHRQRQSEPGFFSLMHSAVVRAVGSVMSCVMSARANRLASGDESWVRG